MKPVKCFYCDEGWRHPADNCVICGWGPAPAAVNFWGEPMPQTDLEKKIVLYKLFNDIYPWTLNGRDYPTPEQLNQ